MTTIFLDLETFCETPITHGTHRYAEGAEILLFAYAIDDGPVRVLDTFETVPALLAAATRIVAHNSGFDRTVLRHAGFDSPLAKWDDTMVRALAHSLPGSLGQLCELLKVPTDKAKDARGKELIQLFCKPRPKNMKLRRATRDTHPAEWAEFVEYARLDIEAMREIDTRLPRWNWSDAERDLWHLDQRINDRGFAVDLPLAEAAITAVADAQARLAEQAQQMTDGAVQAATQRDALLAHVLAEYGVALPDMQKSTLERRVADPDLPEALRELLAVRLEACTTSTSKYKALVRASSSDGRLRGTLQFCGASRTGRWAGRLFQPQNLCRPNMEASEIETGIVALKSGCADLLFPSVMALASSAIRGCIVAPAGRKLVVADLSNIEGRVLAWLAGEGWKLRAFREFDAGTGHDLYKLAYAKSFSVQPGDVTKDQRQVGKVQELALGYQGGVGAFLTFAAAYGIDLEAMGAEAIAGIPATTAAEARDFMEWLYGQDKRTNPQHWIDQGASAAVAREESEKHRKAKRHGLSEQAFIVCDSFKRLWREAHPATATLWRDIEDGVRAAILNRGDEFFVRKLRMRCDGAWLRIGLPSGRWLCYPSPKLDDDGISYMGINQYSRKWERLRTYGGKLVENATQAVARDVLAGNMPAIEAAGYQIVLTVHDENITEAPDTPEFNHEHLAALMAAVPDWANGLPLAAAGFEATRYRKD